ncbi:MAG: TlpA family protein disulfide reductase, partial [Isosphaeraceae bacterium]|nr:TlpA family protein disulfide reductase [Isosphaeraceae bacterium]
AEAPSGPEGEAFSSRQELNASYERQREALIAEFKKRDDQLEDRREADLAALAARQKGAEAEATYRELFYRAINRRDHEAAAKGARQYLDAGRTDLELEALATYILALAEAERDQDEKAIEHLQAFLKRHPSADANRKIPPETIFAVGEAFLQHLIRAGRYDSARKVCELFLSGDPDPAVKQHFQGRKAQLDLLGEPAPAIAGKDVDGETVRLADWKGKVILVNFWATWCPPCLADIPHLQSLYARYHNKGLEILGVNVDAEREGVGDRSQARAKVRRFLIEAGIRWPNLLNGEGPDDFTQTYHVTSIPAAFLIDRQGQIVEIESRGQALERAIAKAFGDEEKKGED